MWAYPTHKDDTSNFCTRCCGRKDAVGRKDIAIPGTHTTFIVHFLKENNENINEKLTKVKAADRYRFNFIVSRKRGPVIGIRTQGKPGKTYESMRSNWLKFQDGHRGYVSGYKNPYNGNFPSMEDTFTLETGL